MENNEKEITCKFKDRNQCKKSAANYRNGFCVHHYKQITNREDYHLFNNFKSILLYLIISIPESNILTGTDIKEIIEKDKSRLMKKLIFEKELRTKYVDEYKIIRDNRHDDFEAFIDSLAKKTEESCISLKDIFKSAAKKFTDKIYSFHDKMEDFYSLIDSCRESLICKALVEFNDRQNRKNSVIFHVSDKNPNRSASNTIATLESYFNEVKVETPFSQTIKDRIVAAHQNRKPWIDIIINMNHRSDVKLVVKNSTKLPKEITVTYNLTKFQRVCYKKLKKFNTENPESNMKVCWDRYGNPNIV